MKLRYFVLIFLLIVTSWGCGDEAIVPKPENLIEEETYIRLLVEVQLLDALAYTTDSLSTGDSLKQVLFSRYNVTEELYLQSNAYYQSQIDDHIARLDSARSLLETEIKNLKQAQDSGSDSESSSPIPVRE